MHLGGRCRPHDADGDGRSRDRSIVDELITCRQTDRPTDRELRSHHLSLVASPLGIDVEMSSSVDAHSIIAADARYINRHRRSHLPPPPTTTTTTRGRSPRDSATTPSGVFSVRDVKTRSSNYLSGKVFFPVLSSKGWLGSRVVSVPDSGAEGPGFKSQPRRCRVTVLGKLFAPIVPLFT